MLEKSLPDLIENESQLDGLLAKPLPDLVELMSNLDGDVMILGVAGKMGISLGQLAVEAIRIAGVQKQVFGVARFSEPGSRERLESVGVQAIRCDLLDRAAVAALPQVRNVVFMAGRKFGTDGAQSLTWAMNTLVPANVAEHFRASNIVAFSTGCVYPLVSLENVPDETVDPAPLGEYAQSCLGRERIFQHYSNTHGTGVCLYRLNYSIDLRYGVLHDIAEKIWRGAPVDNSVAAFNVIWQGDANHQALMCLSHCSSPATILNVTGPELLSTENVARQMGQLMGKPVQFATVPGQSCYLSDSSRAIELFGKPSVSAEQLIRWQAHWVSIGGRSLGKPTHFEVSDGNF